MPVNKVAPEVAPSFPKKSKTKQCQSQGEVGSLIGETSLKMPCRVGKPFFPTE